METRYRVEFWDEQKAEMIAHFYVDQTPSRDMVLKYISMATANLNPVHKPHLMLEDESEKLKELGELFEASDCKYKYWGLIMVGLNKDEPRYSRYRIRFCQAKQLTTKVKDQSCTFWW